MLNNGKKYKIIYADPPWEYKESGSGNRVVHAHYSTMSIDDICNMPINELADDNCILFIWVTFPRLKEGIKVIEEWGFKYKGLGFCWIKKNKKTNSDFWGMGYYTRQNPEVCLIGVKGKYPSLSKDIHCLVKSKIREHSRKPDEIRNKIVEICGDKPRIELFARQRFEGWDAFGNELDNKIQKKLT